MSTTATRPIGLIVVGSFAAGAVLAAVAVAAPFLEARENILAGGVLVAFAFGWALLAGLSVRFTDQPQRWAVAPALFMGVAGVLSFLDSDPLRHGVLAWVWPPALLGLVVWMIIRARRDLVSRTRRWVVYPVLATLTLVAVGAGYETARESADTIAYPAPGQLVDVGGHRLHLNCTGSGSPTVVLEPGLGETSMGWAWIAPAVAADTRVCVYDRAGRGWSEAADDQQRGADVAAELHTLLHRGNVPGPYVLAGHSFGGLYVRSFAAQFPDEVAGMVLVDSTAARARRRPRQSARPTIPSVASQRYCPRCSVRGGPAGSWNSYNSLPPAVQDEAWARGATAENLDSFLDEFLDADSEMARAGSLVDLAGKPLIVLTAGQEHDEAWMAAQDATVALSTNSRHRVVEQATHSSLLLEQDDAAETSQAIRDVVNAVRTSTVLASD